MNAALSRWELAAENIAVKIRWFGLLFGYLLVNIGEVEHRAVLNAILALGVVYALIDTIYRLQDEIFLRRWPVVISLMEALFIAMLCFEHDGLESPFRYYYMLSLICCAIRHSTRVTYITWALHTASFVTLYFVLEPDRQKLEPLILTLVIIGWVTWASSALASLLKRVGDHLSELNQQLEEHRTQLEARIAERTRELQQSQAHVLHQEKMAAFGLLAAGIAHEVGNPLTSISSLIQMLQRRDQDGYTREKLALVSGQLDRIQTTLRELVNFSRPASTMRTRVSIAEVVQEALNIAKYYKRTKGRHIEANVPRDLPAVIGVRDQLVQVFLNLILNAIDATDTGGQILVRAEVDAASPLAPVLRGEGPGVRGSASCAETGPSRGASNPLTPGPSPPEYRGRGEKARDQLIIHVEDNGVGIAAENQGRLFQPYFTTKKHGTGLGLFVTRALVVEHGGMIEVTSRPREGTQFRLCLPTAPAVEPQRHREHREEIWATDDTQMKHG